ncbi:MAG: VOC family protein [Patescibacteria group bacterium]
MTKVFVNLPVKDLDKSTEFFSKLGFKLNPQFADNNVSCLFLNDDTYVMLIKESFFKSISRKEVIQADRQTEVIVAWSVNSKEQVNQMVDFAIANGGKFYRETSDQGWICRGSFQDLDNHVWQVIWMDATAIPVIEEDYFRAVTQA